MINQLDVWHKTKLGLLAFGLLELMITYAFVSLSIDRGNLLWYILSLVFLIGSLQNIFKLIGKILHGK